VKIYYTIIDGGSQHQGASAIACSQKRKKKKKRRVDTTLAKIQKEHDYIPTA
jgi:hypothetical protein